MNEIYQYNRSASKSSETNSEAKHFCASIKVEQVGKDFNIFSVLFFMMLCGAPGFWLGFVSIDNAEQLHGWRAFLSVLGVFGGVFLIIVGLILGFIFMTVFEENLRKRKGLPAPFSKKTLVTIDENGLQIAGLGLAKWSDVLSLEGMPDADYALIVYTAPFGKLMLHHEADTLATVLNYYLNQNSAAAISGAQSSRNAAFEFKAVIFHWPTFFTWILAGYLFAIALIIGFPMLKHDAGFFKNLVIIFVAAPIFAWLVWTIPIWQISLFAGKRTKAFDLTQDRLSSKDGAIDIELHSAVVKFSHKSGIGYALDFVTVKPLKGRRLDLLASEEEMSVLKKNFRLSGAKIAD